MIAFGRSNRGGHTSDDVGAKEILDADVFRRKGSHLQFHTRCVAIGKRRCQRS